MTELFTAIVLAGSRSDAPDSLAQAEGVAHKCLINLGERTMIEQVVQTLAQSPLIGQIRLSTSQPELFTPLPGLGVLMEQGRLSFHAAGSTLTDSVLAAAQDAKPPLLITTGDNALHTPQMVDVFCRGSWNSGATASVAMTRADTLLAVYPDGHRAFHRLRDGGWSSGNLYALLKPEALKAAEVFRGGGQFGKRPLRILAAFGLPALLAYKFRLATLDQLMERLSKRFGFPIKAIELAFAEAPIDVDNAADLALTRHIL